MRKFFLSVLVFFSLGISTQAANFNSDLVFPAWKQGEGGVSGVIGKNAGVETSETLWNRSAETGWLLSYIPQIINILMKFLAPILAVMLIYSGLRMVYAGDDENELSSAKQFFGFAVWGLIVIAISFSLMKAVYFVLL